jgi:ribosomal protein L37E
VIPEASTFDVSLYAEAEISEEANRIRRKYFMRISFPVEVKGCASSGLAQRSKRRREYTETKKEARL